MSEPESSPATAQAEAVEELLRQLVDARFVLTDRDGAVTRWSRPAEELFGWPAARMLGRPLVETLAIAGELPEYGGQVKTVARRKDGTELELTLTFVPVGMSQSLEFNGFLEALEIAAPRGNALKQLQRSHKTVVDWVNGAMRGEAQLEEEDLAAGTIVAFKPLIEPPAPVSAEDEEEETANNAATAAAAGQIADAVEAAIGRSDDLERALEGTTAELEEARGEAEAARGAMAKASERDRGARHVSWPTPGACSTRCARSPRRPARSASASGAPSRRRASSWSGSSASSPARRRRRSA